MNKIYLFLIKYLANKPKLRVIRNVIFDKYHYSISIKDSLTKQKELKEFKEAYAKAEQVYNILEKQKEYHKVILTYVNKDTRGVVKSIVKKSIILLYTNKLV